MLAKETYVQIGQILKNFRLKRKLSIDKISSKTNISIQNLVNIEKGDFHLLAGKFYQRSFIKSYCAALRISERKILLLFDNASNESYKKNQSFEGKEDHLKKTSAPLLAEKIPTIPLIIFASLGIISIFLFNLYKHTGQQSGEQMVAIPPKIEQELPAIEDKTVSQIEESAILEQVRIEDSDIQDYQIKNNENNIKQIIAKNDVWIEIKDIDENILISTILKKDEFFKLPSTRSEVVISSSNAGSLVLKDENSNFTDLGSFGDILNSVQLNSLITNH